MEVEVDEEAEAEAEAEELGRHPPCGRAVGHQQHRVPLWVTSGTAFWKAALGSISVAGIKCGVPGRNW